jgi:hypothetical protein
MKAVGERNYYAYSFSISALDGGEWPASRSGRALAPGKGLPIPKVQEAGWVPEPVWTQRLEEKSFRLCRGSNFDCPVVRSVARHYTDWATRFTKYVGYLRIYWIISRGQPTGLVLHLGDMAGLRSPHDKDQQVSKCYTELRTCGNLWTW